MTAVLVSHILQQLTAVVLQGHGPGDVLTISDECLRWQSNVTNGEDVSGPVSE